MKKTIPIIGICLATATASTLFLASGWRSASAATTKPLVAPITREALLARHVLFKDAFQLMETGDLEGARSMLDGIIANPLREQEVIEAHRMLAMVALRRGDLEDADSHLQDALGMLDAHPSLAVQQPLLKSMILMDQADLAAFGRGDRSSAILLYDRVVGRAELTQPRALLIAEKNAAFLCAKMGRVTEAVQRVDALVASPIAALMSEGDLIQLLASQASWVEGSGDLVGGIARYRSIWNAYSHLDEDVVFLAGVRIASTLPVPLACEERLSLASTLLTKIYAMHSAPSQSAYAPKGESLMQLEREILTIIVNSQGCADPGGLIDHARIQLGLPPVEP